MKTIIKTRKIMKSKLIMLLVMTLMIVSCSKDEEEKQTTKATITVKDASGDAVNGMSVYAYTENTWTTIGDDPFFADKTVSTDSNGKAVFIIDDFHMIFAVDTQENIHFSAHYNLGGVDKIKTTSITFSEEDQKSATLNLN